jgi:hypothetical protein
MSARTNKPQRLIDPDDVLTPAEAKRVRQGMEQIKAGRWLSENEWESWDQEIKADSQAGRLDFLVRQAHDEKADGTLEDEEAWEKVLRKNPAKLRKLAAKALEEHRRGRTRPLDEVL